MQDITRPNFLYFKKILNLVAPASFSGNVVTGKGSSLKSVRTGTNSNLPMTGYVTSDNSPLLPPALTQFLIC